MSFGSYGTEALARRKRVYYEGTDIIYEGMALCYNSDTTESIRTAGNTVAEGDQCDGKYMRVEKPASANLHAFAGVVADGTYIGLAGPRWLDVYVPNGAVVPARINFSATGQQSLACLADASYALTDHGFPIAMVLETVDRSSTNGIALVKLYDIGQYGVNLSSGSGALLASGGGTDNLTPCLLSVTSAHTGGNVFLLPALLTANGTIASNSDMCAVRGYIDVSGTLSCTTSYTRSVLGQLALTGTINSSGAYLCGVMAQISGTPTLTACNKAAALMVDCALGVSPTSGDYVGIRITNSGANQTEVDAAIEVYGGDGINRLFDFDSCADTSSDFISAGGSGNTTLTFATWKKIKIQIDGSDYYLVASTNPVEGV